MQPKPIPSDLMERILSEPFQNRFWDKIKKGGADDCWPWQASRCNKYGQIGIWHNEKRVTRKAHKIAWISYHRKDVPAGKNVLHSCVDCGLCCNPNHLYIGTQKENVRDMLDQGRAPFQNMCGEKHPASKLTNNQVIYIRKQRTAGKTFQAIADEFGVHNVTIQAIVRRVTWKHI